MLQKHSYTGTAKTFLAVESDLFSEGLKGPLLFKLKGFREDRRGITRYLVERRDGKIPWLPNCFESHLAQELEGSHNTRRNALRAVAALYTWCERKQIDLDERILEGTGLTLDEIRKYKFWLSQKENRRKNAAVTKKSTQAELLHYAKAYLDFAIGSYAYRTLDDPRERADRAELAQSRQNKWWGTQKRLRATKAKVLPLSEDDYEAVEAYFLPENRIASGTTTAIAWRDYLIWRLAYEFGLRIGEILALELEHLRFTVDRFIDVVRTDERGPSYSDTRAPYTPKVKTLSRSLGIMLSEKETMVLVALSSYLALRATAAKGEAPEHSVLIVDHRSGSARRLTESRATQIAREAAVATGVAFTWHRARHTFFTRVKKKAHDQGKSGTMDDHLRYVAGHADFRSMDAYTHSLRPELANSALRSLNQETN